MEKIRILQIVSSLSVSSGVMGVIMNYYRHINRNKIQFDFLYFIEDEKNHKDEITELGGNYYLLRKPSIKSYTEYKSFFKENARKYSAVHLHEVYLNSIILPIARKYKIKHLITHVHTTKFSDKRLNAIRNKILCLPIKGQANKFLACSRPAGELYYGKKASNDGRVIVINNAIYCEKFKYNELVRNQKRKEMGLEDNLVIGHIGRFNEQKNHMFLIDIFKDIKWQKEKAKLILVGNGPLLTKVKEKVERLGLKNDVLFLGQRNDISDLLQVMDVFVLPSLFEGLGIVLLEAQCSGLPCYASDVVPQEANVTDNFHYLSLNDKSKKWATEILSAKSENDRSVSYLKVMKYGFDIIEESKKLENLYYEL
ncbi:glycosyltransferase family 1 protein [Bacillus massilinigeriensis]|uniref:glycosyltransferase family 1 protein n=1 Tax=Bacillus massilionigeriensis TaxID=1805475 RepID=UPI00096B6795|nr:glycosyltransferase family 1 protein [Bacillus massilionigeriensis]